MTMRCQCTWIVFALIVVGEGKTQPDAPARESQRASRRITAKINRYFEEFWKAEKIQPAPQAEDARFLRRLSLTLRGRIPAVSEVREFLADRDLNKRAKQIERMLESASFVTHFTNVWIDTWLPETDVVNNNPAIRAIFADWLRTRLAEDVPYDRMVREIVAVEESTSARPGASPVGYYIARQQKPEEMAGATARLFLGVSLECAQCHGHPFATWSKTEFWEFAAFFSNARRAAPDGRFESQILIPGTQRVVQANFLGGKKPTWKDNVGPRTTLAEWMTNPENRRFARQTVNQVWKHLFSEGLAESQYDLSDDTLHEKLLDILAEELIKNRYDLKILIRAMVQSRPWQLTSKETHSSQRTDQAFAKWKIQGMSPEQLWDSIGQAAGFPPNRQITARAQFIRAFKSQERAHERSTSILQSLALMNGSLLHEATRTENDGTLAAILDSPFFTKEQRIEAMFLTTFARSPRAEEIKKITRYLDGAKNANERRQFYSDVYWALLNSSEFALNH